MVRRKIVLLYGRAPVIDLKIPPRPPKIKTPEPHIACGSFNFWGVWGNTGKKTRADVDFGLKFENSPEVFELTWKKVGVFIQRFVII